MRPNRSKFCYLVALEFEDQNFSGFSFTMMLTGLNDLLRLVAEVVIV